MRIRVNSSGGTFLVMIAILFACRPVTAQNVGDRVRVTTAADTVIGDLSHVSEYGLTLAVEDGESREFALAEVQRLEIHKTANNGYWGLLAGSVLGGAVAAASAREIQVTRKLCRPGSRANMFGECADTYRGTVTEKEYTAAGYIAVVAGAAAGYFLGRRLRFGGWEEVPHPANSRESVERVRGNANRLVLTPIVDAQPGPDGSLGVILGMSVRFVQGRR